MIQELLGGSSVGLINGGDQRSSTKISAAPVNCGGNINVDGSPSHSPSPSPSPSSSSAAPASVAPAAENLRCPRCDSSNTKFCYYNNYNLTQPRHFCKTCRRYWTKGGALRNVPIGGGCRKNKNTNISAAVAKSSAASKFKTAPTDHQMGKSGIFGGFEHGDALSSNPILWASPQNSHLLSILRSNQNQNQNPKPNPNPNPSHLPNPVKEEGSLFGSSHFSSESPIRILGLDHLNPTHLPSMGMQNSYYRNQTQGFIHGDHLQVQNNTGFQEVFQRLRSSTSCYPDHTPLILGNVASAINSASSTASGILESAPVATGELGFWNNPSTLSWPTDLSTTNGAYP